MRGFVNDFIEPKIKPLVEALNSWEGINTFSSCEGHNHEDRSPFVTFDCEDIEALQEISKNLFGTSWRIVLNDLAISKGDDHHYTLRYAPKNLFHEVSIKEIQEEIPKIADLLHVEGSGPEEIKNSFPVLKCKYCGSEEFRINDCWLTFSLGYHERFRLPMFEINFNDPDILFHCYDCMEELELEDPESTLIKLLTEATELEDGLIWQ